MANYQFEVTVSVSEDEYRSIVHMEVYDREDSDPARLPIAEESAPYYHGMDLSTLAERTWEWISIPPMPEINDLVKNGEESK